jgi:rare lipoprotein A
MAGTMGLQSVALRWNGITRVAALAGFCLAFAGCSGPFGNGAKYSQRVVEGGEPVPKGGGTYHVGRPYSINGRTYFPAEDPRYRAEGIASWYGRDFHGRLTANGEVYDMHSISAAHATMPLPSYARVTNLDNSRSIIVRVNDRGPYSRGRVIDVSIGAAKALNFHGRGLARVRVEYVGQAPLEGSDDLMLMATLREGSPAPAPSKIMVASAKPFLSDAPLPAERPLAVGRGAAGIAAPAPATEVSSTSWPRARSNASAMPELADEPPMPASDGTGYAPLRSEGPAFGLMSGRGLY